MIKRIVKNYWTTLLSLAIMLVVGWLFHGGRLSFTEASGWLSAALLLFISKDPEEFKAFLRSRSRHDGYSWLLIVCLAAAWSCTVVRPGTNTVTREVVTLRDTVFTAPGGMVQANIDALAAKLQVRDTTGLYQLLKQLSPGSHSTEIRYMNGRPQVVYSDTGNRAELRLMLDENGKLRAECEAKDMAFKAVLKDKIVSEESETKKIISQVPGWLYKVVIAFMLLLVLAFIFLQFKK
jgi:hypothetical protein